MPSKIVKILAVGAVSAGQCARLMRDIRDYGVHPRQVTDGDIEVCFTRTSAGLLFLESGCHRNTWSAGGDRGDARPLPF